MNAAPDPRALGAAAERRRAQAVALRAVATSPAARQQLDLAARLFADVTTLFLAHVDTDRPQPGDALWLSGAEAYFRAACIFLDRLEADLKA